VTPSPAMLPGGWTLAEPFWLLALLLLPLAAWWRSRRPRPVLVIPRVAKWAGAPAVSMGRMPSILAGLGFVALVVALARPQQLEEKKQVRQKGYDIMMAIDLSPSMLAEDYEGPQGRINRLQAIQPIIEAFISRRPTDRIGVVVYGGRAYTLSPLTFDHEWLARQIQRLKIGLVEDATAVGDGLGLAVTRLEQAERDKGGQRKGAFVILLTDGSNNSGVLAPLQAAELARARGIPVYTIGAGRPGIVPMPVVDNAGRKLGYRQAISDLDEETLQQIASITDGKFFRAMDVGTAEAAFAAIDRRQRIEFNAKAQIRAHEWFAAFAAPGLAAFFFGIALARPGRWGRTA
jgi:Ca-activated chloride channel family protein